MRKSDCVSMWCDHKLCILNQLHVYSNRALYKNSISTWPKFKMTARSSMSRRATERIKFAWKNRHKFLKNYGIENDYFQEGCFWKLDLDFMSLSGMTRVKKFTKVTINRTENPENGGVRSPSLGACNSHNKPMQRHFYRLVYF